MGLYHKIWYKKTKQNKTLSCDSAFGLSIWHLPEVAFCQPEMIKVSLAAVSQNL